MELPKMAKTVFLLHFIVCIVLGIWYFLAPELWSSVTGWPIETAAGRMLGAAIIAFGIASFLCFRATTWEQVEFLVLMEITWNLLACIGMIWNIAYIDLPIIAWMNTALVGIFFVLFFYLYYDAKLKKA
ncbi:MAG: hypothetical protein ACTSV2_05610 [Candidatus Thorarchaeota archaeon]